MFEIYATGAHTLTTLAKKIRIETGKTISRGNVYLVLKNRFYTGSFEWMEHTYPGTHPVFVKRELFDQVQAVLSGHNRPKYSKREIAFRGLMQCAYDGCMLTGDVQKEKYVYYRCTGHRGKCDLPRFREEDIINRLGEPLKDLQVPSEIVSEIVARIRDDQRRARGKVSNQRPFLESRLT